MHWTVIQSRVALGWQSVSYFLSGSAPIKIFGGIQSFSDLKWEMVQFVRETLCVGRISI